MAHADASVSINRSPAEVYQFLLDGANNRLWRPAVLEITRVPGTPDGVGAAYRQRMKGPGGRPIDGDYEITEAVPYQTIAFLVTAGPARPNGKYSLMADGAGTRVTFTLDLVTTGLTRLMDPIIAATMRGEVANLANLKAYLEAHTA